MTDSTDDSRSGSRGESPDSRLKEGEKVGPYVVEGLLGRGGMGAVYRAHDARLLRTVALKVISLAPDSMRPREEFGARLLREARAAAAINHPNVVSVFDVGEEDDVFFMAMELVKGKTLRELVTAKATWQQKLRWIIDTARALDALHRAGIIHRDVKPENIIVREDGVTKLLDLGIARRAEASAVAPIDTVTGGGAIPGTPVYMSPEQLKGNDLDAATDQFSWAVVAYEVLVGERPWTTKSRELYSILLAIVHDPAPNVGDTVTELPSVVSAVIARALEKDPKARFASLEDAALALDPFAAASALPVPRDRESSSITPRASGPEAFAATTKAPTTLSSPKMDPLPAKRRASRRGLTITAGVIAAAAVIIVAWPKRERPPVIATHRALSAVPEADQDFTDAMQLFRDGASTRAEEKLVQAIKEDDTFARAHLELALVVFSRDADRAQKHFQLAFEHRMNLDEHGAAWLDATQPYVRPNPDLEEWETRLLKVTKLYPKDAEAHYYLGVARERQLKFSDAKKAYENARAATPDYVPALGGIGSAERALGHPDLALAAFRSCLQKSPIAVSCVEAEQAMLAAAGECARAKSDAETWIALDPASTHARFALAEALESTNAPHASVVEALHQMVAVGRPEETKVLTATEEMSIALLSGKFDEAVHAAQSGEAALPLAANRLTRAGWVLRQVLIALETGDTNDAANLADSFLQKMDAYAKAPLDIDPDIDFYEPLLRAKKITRGEFDVQRRAWIQKELDSLSGREAATQASRMPTLWVKAWASPVETPDEAKEALSVVSNFGAAPTPEQSPLRVNFTLGRVFALAGNYDEAVARLTRVTRACAALSEPQTWTRAHYYLGLAYEGQKDVDRARRAYGVVVERWGHAESSVTAKLAREHLEKLPANTLR